MGRILFPSLVEKSYELWEEDCSHNAKSNNHPKKKISDWPVEKSCCITKGLILVKYQLGGKIQMKSHCWNHLEAKPEIVNVVYTDHSNYSYFFLAWSLRWQAINLLPFTWYKKKLFFKFFSLQKRHTISFAISCWQWKTKCDLSILIPNLGRWWCEEEVDQ